MIFDQPTCGQQRFVQQTFVQQTFVQQTFVQQTFVQQTFDQQTFVQQTFGQQAFGQQAFDQQTFVLPTFGQQPSFITPMILSFGRQIIVRQSPSKGYVCRPNVSRPIGFRRNEASLSFLPRNFFGGNFKRFFGHLKNSDRSGPPL
jgi:hypothetical protein